MSRPAAPPKDRLILVDTKEATQHDLWFEDGDTARFIPGTLINEGLRFELRALMVGDFQLRLRDDGPTKMPWLIVESKTWPDLVASVRDDGADREDSRLRHQVAGLLDLKKQGYQVAVMTVGVLTPSGAKRAGVYIQNKGRRQFKKWDWFEVIATVTALQHLGIMWFPAPSEAQVPRALRITADLVERTEHFDPPGLAPIAWLTPKLSQLARTFTAVEGVGRTMAMELALNYLSFPDFSIANPDDLEETKGVGKIMAERIYSHFHNKEKAVVPQSLAEELIWT